MLKGEAGILEQFEKEFHGDIASWLEAKLPKSDDLEILDFSLDLSYLTGNIAGKVNAKRTVAAVWHDDQVPMAENVQPVHVDLKPADGFNFSSLGTFNSVICREMLHIVQDDLVGFFKSLKDTLKEKESRIFILTRPKNPPVPLPDNGIDRWRKTSPSRETILVAAVDAGYSHECYAVSCPVRIKKQDWGTYLKGRYLAALNDNVRCSDHEINDFIKEKPSPYLEFEEKILIFVLTMKGENKEKTPTNKN